MHQAQDYKPLRFAICAVKQFEALAPMTSDVVAPAAETTAANAHGDAHSTAGFKALLIGSIGVVYGDIGTSPLYALREAVMAATTGSTAPAGGEGGLGILSLLISG